jgi:uncharacterized membrane protein
MNIALAVVMIFTVVIVMTREISFTAFLVGVMLALTTAGLISARKRLARLEREFLKLRELLQERHSVFGMSGEAGTDRGPLDTAGAEAGQLSVQGVRPDAGPQIRNDAPIDFPDSTETVDDRGVDVSLFQSDETFPHQQSVQESHESGSKAFPRSAFFEALRGFLTGGDLLVKTGLLVLFVGVAFLVKYAADRHLLPIEVRLAGAALGGIALIAVGWHLRNRREVYALSLQGGGIGILYLVVFAAFRLYDIIPSVLAFGLLVALCVFSAMLAVLQNSSNLAILGIAGGFLAPVLTSTGHGSHIMLFSYYALLNAGILCIAWFKTWRILNLVGFVFTFGIGTLWGYNQYNPGYFASTEPFLIFFFLLYVAIAVLFALRQPLHLKGYVDVTIVFGTPVIAFSQQVSMVSSYEFGSAISAVTCGFVYSGLAWVLFRWKPLQMRLLSESFLSIGIAFGTIAIPLALDSRGIASAWALEGAALVWIGIRQKKTLARICGIALQALAGLALLVSVVDVGQPAGSIPFINGLYLGCLAIALGGSFSSWYLYRHGEQLTRFERGILLVLGTWGIVWWYGAGLYEIQRFVGPKFLTGAILVFVSVSCMGCDYLKRRLEWSALVYPAMGLLPMMFAIAVLNCGEDYHPFAGGGFAGWPFAFGVLYRILHANDDLSDRFLKYFHAGTIWLAALLIVWESAWQADYWTSGRGGWDDFAAGISASVIILLSIKLSGLLSLPANRQREAYALVGPGPIAVLAWVGAVIVSFSSIVDPWPFGYFPLINPLDVSTGLVFASVIAWLLLVRATGITIPVLDKFPGRAAIPFLACISAFLWMNAVLIRSIHYWGGVAFSFPVMVKSVLLQACLSIFWSFTALLIMVYSTRKRIRTLWLAGAVLLGVVVVKLFLVDLAGSGTVERIVSFLAVGVLMLVVGYLSPVPPQDKGASTAK